jgi:CheY-like chemotaxis protein/two-component sensor histidine kinase
MAPMLNALRLLGTADLDSDSALHCREILNRQLAQLVRLVDDLLDVSRISSGKLTIRKEVVALGDIIGAAIETVEPQLEARCHELNVDLPAEAVFVLADSARMAQVLGNLLNNAIKFSEPGSGISLSASADESTVRIEVADHGSGIPADALDGVFEMFSQGGISAELGQTGLGVGLALARQLVRLHGGAIEAASEGAGQGARFNVTIPRAPAPAPAPAHAPAQAPADAQTPGAERQDDLPSAAVADRRDRTLIVDDNVDFAASLAQLLGAIGHDVQVANTGEAALQAAREFEPDVAILDIGLPDIGGHELAGLLRAAAADRPLVQIAVSGWGQESDKQRSLEAGFDIHLVKPVDYQTIQDAIRELRGEGSE